MMASYTLGNVPCGNNNMASKQCNVMQMEMLLYFISVRLACD